MSENKQNNPNEAVEADKKLEDEKLTEVSGGKNVPKSHLGEIDNQTVSQLPDESNTIQKTRLDNLDSRNK